MTKERIYLFDTTLRDGQQTPGVDFSAADKIVIAEMLDDLGLDYVEGGYPGANPTDTEFFSKKRTKNASFVGFGMTKRVGVSASNDPGIAGLIEARTDAICFVAKSWDYHVEVALGCTNEENVEAITASVHAATKAGREVLVDCEHFFDGYKANPGYALDCLRAARDAGAAVLLISEDLDEVLAEGETKTERGRVNEAKITGGTHLGQMSGATKMVEAKLGQ